MSLFLTTTIVFLIVIFLMAIGVIAGKVQIKGSCGGLNDCGLCFFKGRKECPKKRRDSEDDDHNEDRVILMNDYGD